MAKTYPNGVVSPAPGDQIPANGAGAWDLVAASTDAQLGDRSRVGHTHAWGQITGKPTNFSPSSHTHPVSQITDLQTVLATALAPKANVEAVELGAGADANTITTPGRYVETNAADAAAIVNFPEQRAGILDVAANGDRLHVWQLWRPYTGNRMFMRSRTGGTWASWEQIVTGSDPRLTDARAPLAHQHPISDTSGLQAALDAKARKEPVDLADQNLNDVIDEGPYVQASSSIATAARNYPANGNGLYTAGFLDVVSRPGDYLVKQYFTAFNGLDTMWRTRYAGTWNQWRRTFRADEATTALAGKANTVHTHPWADVTGKPATYPATAHSHAQADVTGLVTALAGKMNLAATGIVNVDLDGLFAPGFYSQGSSTTASNPALHYPAPYAGRLLVMANPTQTQITQVYWTYFSTSASEMFWRSHVSGSWGPWARVATLADLEGLVESSDSRLTDAREPLVHAHGISDVQGLADALNAADNTDDVAALASRIDGLGSAYDVWVGQGNTGSEADFLASLEGEPGPEGPYGGTAVTDPQVASWVGDVATQTGAKLDARYRTVASVREHGAVGDGVADDSAAVASALTAGAGGAVHFPAGAYRLTQNFTVPADTTITGAGSAVTLLDWSTKAGFDASFFLSWTAGTFADATVLTVDALPGDISVTVASGHNFAVGDWVRLRADNILWGEATPAEYQRVLTVEGGVLTLSGPVFDTYAVENTATLEKAVLPSGGIQGLTIRGKGINTSGYGDTAIRAALVRDFFAEDVHFDAVENKCILLNSVLGASVTDCSFRFDPSFTPLQYGVAVTGGCQMITVRGCSAWNDRHMFTTSTSKSLNSEYRGIPRVLTVTGCTAHGSWQAPIDTHRGGEYITITGNSLNSESVGVKIRGSKAVITGNSIVGKRVSKGGGARGLYIGMVAEDVVVSGNLIAGFEDGIRIDTTDPTSRNIAISGNSIVNCTRGVYLGATARVDQVQVSGNTMRPEPGGVGVFFFAAAADVEIVGNTITGGHTAIFMSHPTNRVDRLMVNGNTCRQQTTRAMYFRWVYDGLVTSNFSPGKEIRFTDTCERVTTGLNQATINDMTTGTTITQK